MLRLLEVRGGLVVRAHQSLQLPREPSNAPFLEHHELLPRDALIGIDARVDGADNLQRFHGGF